MLLFNVPAGIGDISWIYSKIKHLKSLTGGQAVKLRVAGEPPPRGEAMVRLLPEVEFAGMATDIVSWHVASQPLNSEWPAYMGLGPFNAYADRPINIAANNHLECGRPLHTWMPMLPTDYHYPLAIPPKQMQLAENLLAGLPRPIICVYVSNRDKDSIKHVGWSLWTPYQWVDFCDAVSRVPACQGCGFVFLGATWDEDKTTDVADELAKRGHPVRKVIGQPLGTALHCLAKSDYSFSYPSGIGIMSNVLRTPGLMLLPWHLKGLETGGYADPLDVALQHYRCWANPSPEEAFKWFRDVSLVQLMVEHGNKWPAR